MKRYAKIFVSCLLTFTMVFTSVQWSAIVHETTVVGAAETVSEESSLKDAESQDAQKVTEKKDSEQTKQEE